MSGFHVRYIWQVFAKGVKYDLRARKVTTSLLDLAVSRCQYLPEYWLDGCHDHIWPRVAQSEQHSGVASRLNVVLMRTTWLSRLPVASAAGALEQFLDV